MPGLIAQNEDIYANDASSSKKSWFQISVKSVLLFRYEKRLQILQFAYALLCKLNYGVTITSHNFINIFQTVHSSAVKFTRDNEKNMNFLLIPKSQKV